MMIATRKETTPPPAPLRPLPPDDEMYRAVESRDASYTGIFFVAVKTTGVFCRPGCTARTPRRENVEFFPSASDALHAGYRPCKVCRPGSDGIEPASWVRDLIDRIEEAPGQRLRDCDLRARSLDPARVRRYFQKHYGMTFQAYQRARRLSEALREMRERSAPLAQLGYRNGYESDSGFRDAFTKMYGDPPGRARRTVEHLCAHWLHDTPLGPMIAVAGDRGVCLLEFLDRRALEREMQMIRAKRHAAITPGMNAHLETLVSELEAYFGGRLRSFTVPIDARGTPWQEAVWERLRAIPCGETVSYSHIARELGREGAQRAVGRANGDNPVAILTPCHRVVREDGSLCGYGGGLWRKKWLLDHETQNREAPWRKPGA